MSARTIRERPILMSGPMVRAILDGQKTVTRRLLKSEPAPTDDGIRIVRLCGTNSFAYLDFDGVPGLGWRPYGGAATEPYPHPERCCPYGVPGDRLWVRETWGPSFVQRVPPGRPRTLGGTWGVPAHPEWTACAVYRADGDMPPAPDGIETARWTPSIHMPRWASRITLEIESVRVERLQDITEEDAHNEGVEATDGTLDAVALCRRAKEMGQCAEDARVWFAELWDAINGKRAPWASNPWVWRVEFRRVEVKP